MIGVHDTFRTHSAVADRHVQSVDDELGVLDGVDGPPDDSATAGVHDAAAISLPFQRGMFRHVTDPEFVQS